jgi:hypothetical protein
MCVRYPRELLLMTDDHRVLNSLPILQFGNALLDISGNTWHLSSVISHWEAIPWMAQLVHEFHLW